MVSQRRKESSEWVPWKESRSSKSPVSGRAPLPPCCWPTWGRGGAHRSPGRAAHFVPQPRMRCPQPRTTQRGHRPETARRQRARSQVPRSLAGSFASFGLPVDAQKANGNGSGIGTREQIRVPRSEAPAHAAAGMIPEFAPLGAAAPSPDRLMPRPRRLAWSELPLRSRPARRHPA